MLAETKKVQVLIVEDSKTQAEWLKVTLEEVGMYASVADSLADCLQQVRREQFDAIMLDLTLPDSIGIGTLLAVQSSAPSLPVIVLTAIEEDFGMESLRNGAEDYLIKGETAPGVLVRSIRYAIERKNQARALRQTQRQTREIIERAQDAFLSINLDGTIVDWNRKAQHLLGWSRMEALGENIETLICAENREEFKSAIECFSDTGGGALIADKIELNLQHKLGRVFPAELAFFPVHLAEGTLLCAFACDITNRKEVAQRMNEFYATVSHELRSPITSIKGSMRLLESGMMGEFDDEAQKMLTVSIESCDRMLRLISDLLELSKIEAGKMDYDFSEVNPAKLVTSTLEGIKGMASEAHVELVSAVEIPHAVLGDSDKIVQVLTNLVSNAIKFSPENGEIEVKVESGSAGRVRFSITDQGPGIPAEDMHKMFGKFQQLENAASIQMKGTGLGLAISKAIVAQHNGDIGVDSVEGKGTTFWFEVPAAC